MRFHFLDDGLVHSKAFTYAGKRGNILTPCVGYKPAIQENFMSVSVVEDDFRRNSKSAVCRATVIFVLALQASCRWSLWAANYHTPALNDFLGLGAFRWSRRFNTIRESRHSVQEQHWPLLQTQDGQLTSCVRMPRTAAYTAVYGTIFSRLKWLFMACVLLRNNSDLVTQFTPYNTKLSLNVGRISITMCADFNFL